jgi:hypothetical protein
VVQGPFTATALSSTELTSDYKSPSAGQGNSIASSWKLSSDISHFPVYHSGYKITDALYNLALEEMQHAVEPDSTFRTGKEWGGVWTRDISYSIILSMAVLQPKVAVYSLMRKVKDGRIIQDTGTGGAYPISSDRMIWAVAAWEVYKVTGDMDWLKKAYAIIKKSAGDDEANIADSATGLVRGESSFLDWREETYPRWMQPADIYESECLGTNVVHFEALKVLAAMANLLNDPSANADYSQKAKAIRDGINAYLWLPAQGYYGQYLYGRSFKSLSPRSEALGEALAIYFGATDDERQQSVISNTPVNDFGIPCIYPQIPGIPPYHNNAVWPFVETYWALASAKAGDEKSLLRAMGAVYRPAALFLTNKENFVVSSGDYAGTQINSSNMLWSLSGNLALVYKVLFGMQYSENSLVFKPFVPRALTGERTLKNFTYRNAVLDIKMRGFGNEIRTFRLDGKRLPNAEIPAVLKGRHTVEIVLFNNLTDGKSNLQPGYTAPETPVLNYQAGKLFWKATDGAVRYQVIKNGKKLANTKMLTYNVAKDQFAEYQVAATDAKGVRSFNSEPVQVIPANDLTLVELESVADRADLPYTGASGTGFVEISKTKHLILTIPVTVKTAGFYSIDFKYANGNGPINTENKCAMRTLLVEDHFAGTVVFPQRGKDAWNDWGYSNAAKVRLSKGMHTLTLKFGDANENMNGDINQAMIDLIRLVKIGE